MADQIVRPVCGLCGKVFNEYLDDDDERYVGWFEDEERNEHYKQLCPECYGVVVEGEPEEREWLEQLLE